MDLVHVTIVELGPKKINVELPVTRPTCCIQFSSGIGFTSYIKCYRLLLITDVVLKHKLGLEKNIVVFVTRPTLKFQPNPRQLIVFFFLQT